MEVSKEAVDDFIEFKDQYMKQTVWDQDCRSWYKGNTANGKNVALWPGSTVHYLETMKNVRYEDFKVKHFGNRFGYLGNGMTKMEMMPDADLAGYIRNEDDDPFIGSKFTYAKASPELSSLDVTSANANAKL